MSLSPLCPEPWGKEVRKARSQSCSSVVPEASPTPTPWGAKKAVSFCYVAARPSPAVLSREAESVLGKRERWGSRVPKGTQKAGWGNWGLQILSSSILIIAPRLPRGWIPLGPGMVLISSSCLLHYVGKNLSSAPQLLPSPASPDPGGTQLSSAGSFGW